MAEGSGLKASSPFNSRTQEFDPEFSDFAKCMIPAGLAMQVATSCRPY